MRNAHENIWILDKPRNLTPDKMSINSTNNIIYVLPIAIKGQGGIQISVLNNQIEFFSEKIKNLEICPDYITTWIVWPI